MQRIVPQGARVASNAGRVLPTFGTATPHAQTHLNAHAAPVIVAADDEEDWSFVQDPVTAREVTEVLLELSDVTGLRRARSEGDWSSSTTSDGHRADELIASADRAMDSTPAFRSLTDMVTDVLNDHDASTAISNALRNSPAFTNIIHPNRAPALPAPAQILTLPAPEGSTWSGGSHRTTATTTTDKHHHDNPIDYVWNKIVEAVCAFGSSIRKIPHDIAIVLKGLRGGERRIAVAAGVPDHVLESMDKEFQAAVKRVVTAVAVALLTRRAVIRFA